MIFEDLFSIIKKKINPVKYWRKKGSIIGDDCDINASMSIISEPYLVKIGNHVRISDNVKLITHDGGVWVCRGLFDEYRDSDLFGRICIGNNVHIGANVTIMPGVSIGNNVIIGCGAVVTHSMEDNVVVAGIPAKIIKTVDEYIIKNNDSFVNTKHMDYLEKKKFLEEYFLRSEQ